MFKMQQGFARSGLIILLLIAAAVVILFLLPTPKPDAASVAATTTSTTTADADCLAVPADFSTPSVVAATPPASLWEGWSYGNAIMLTATPVAALVDESVTIRVSGLKPNEPITLRASLSDYMHRAYSAEVTYLADSNGVVDVTRDAPKYGSYSGVHAMGLIWSMLPENLANPNTVFYAPPGDTFPIQLQALADGRVLTQTSLIRNLMAPGVKKTIVNTNGLVGELYTPATPGPHPAVMVLGGSEGGSYPQVNEAALLASHGYTALGLAYFQGFQAGDPRLASLPKMLTDIPLEYFAKAADWLRQQPSVDPKHIAILGWSKGAEAALITAATFPKDFQAVVTFMPGSAVWAGINYGPGPITSSWTLHGKPLPWVNPVMNASMFSTGKPLVFLGAYQNGLKDAAAFKKAVIPVENIAGPILLISATDDQIWPSPLMAHQIMQRRAAHHVAYQDESLCYIGAGHGILPPWRPTNATVAGIVAFGGNPVAYAFADQDAWSKVLTFLHESLR